MGKTSNQRQFRGEGLIFVGGAPRSGTTLVQRILNAHPDIYGGPEFDMLPSLMHQRNLMLDKVKSGRIAAFVNEEEVDDVFREVIRALLIPKRQKEGVLWLSEKTPANALVFPELITLFPHAKFVLCMRDPRSIVGSMKEVFIKQKVSGKGSTPFVRSVVASVDHVNSCWSAGERALSLSKKPVVVYYEDLVTASEKALRLFFDALEIPFNPKVLNLEGSDYESPILRAKTDTAFYSQEQLTSGIKSGSLDKWKSILGRWEVQYIEQTMYSGSAETCERYGLNGKRRYLSHYWVMLKHSIMLFRVIFNRFKNRLNNGKK